jgi:hypothetical protein
LAELDVPRTSFSRKNTPFGSRAPTRRGETEDQAGHFVSEPSVCRLLKRFALVESPASQLVTAADRFAFPTAG